MATEASMGLNMSNSGSLFTISIPGSLASSTEDNTNDNINLVVAQLNLNTFAQG